MNGNGFLGVGIFLEKSIKFRACFYTLFGGSKYRYMYRVERAELIGMDAMEFQNGTCGTNMCGGVVN